VESSGFLIPATRTFSARYRAGSDLPVRLMAAIHLGVQTAEILAGDFSSADWNAQCRGKLNRCAGGGFPSRRSGPARPTFLAPQKPAEPGRFLRFAFAQLEIDPNHRNRRVRSPQRN
jgi:hypothetical protein